MKYIEYPLFAEGFINHFLTTGVYTKPQQFEKAILKGRVNEWLKKGFSIHENPCRKEFVAKRQAELPPYLDLSQYSLGEKVEVFGEVHPVKFYAPFGNIAQEESGFYYTPTYLRTYSYAILKAEKEETVEFELTTCGGVTLWVNDQLVEDFIPFTRNLVKSTTVTVNLRKGENKFIICLDDLAERDTDYYFRLKRMGNASLTVLLPVAEKVRTELVLESEKMLDNICFEKEAYISEPLKLRLNNMNKQPMEVKVTITPGEFIEKMEENWKLIQYRNYELQPEQQVLTLMHSDEIHPGYYYFTVEMNVDGIVLKRKIGTQLVRKDFLSYQEEKLEDRKRRALETVIQFGVNNVYKSAALFKLGRDFKLAEAIILEELAGVRKRKDCCDFHFVIILYIYRTFHEVLSDKLKQEIEEAMLNFRYWIDEPGDDVMWFFSENHALLFHICQYLAGKYLPEQFFTNSSRLGKEVEKRGAELLTEWFEEFFKEFITEWNSNAYIPVDVIGIATLYNLTEPENEFHSKAKTALDMIFYALSINEHRGAVMTSFGRSYEKELKGNYNAGTTALLYLAYNAGHLNRAVIGYIALALGDYEAPEEYKKYLKLTGSQQLIHQNTQGFEQHVNLYLYKNSEVVLSTAVGFKPYQPGYQEHIVQAAIDKTAQVFVNHPGESHTYGSGRPNFWAGNGVLPFAAQYKNVSILKYKIAANYRIDYTHAYIPLIEFERYIGDKNVIVLEKDGAYIGVYANNGLSIQEKGPCQYKEFISPGRENIWIIKVVKSCDYENLDDFFREFRKIQIDLSENEQVNIIDNTTSYQIDSNNEFLVNGQTVYQYPLSVQGIIQWEE
ncbi:hypothetical protein acsn021_24370 [Anaerocolumna cellulosilytica]|uniref:Uncharacterized protein n=1 Tax=Anaerocolumna cellulosilytica TaxID=433286 RepID=A0A6S6R790_9FIRM|nr:hypothetical protein [Anaerocolumna cellulosilytica]MBB5193918.1 hypothetical protein [Anaerocolumna cellulosilytica]BCJ94868.1 hypothetical protein acsn021_24370 [Anaerocolumna cellulosilytica]